MNPVSPDSFSFQLCDILFIQKSVLPLFDIQSQMHETDPFQIHHLIVKYLTHSSDLPIITLHQNDIEYMVIDLSDFTWQSCDP